MKKPKTAAPAPSKGERTRETILLAAENIFAQLGYQEATLRDVAAAAGIQQPGLYNYFATKDDLYNEVLRRMMNPILSMLADRKKKEVEELIFDRGYLDLLLDNRNIAKLLIRAFLSEDKTERDIAMTWVEKVLETGPLDRAVANPRPRTMPEAIRDMAIFNAWIGYFWTAPMIERMTGKSIADPEMVKVHKAFIAAVAKAF